MILDCMQFEPILIYPPFLAGHLRSSGICPEFTKLSALPKATVVA